jgi:endonuclease/exonuclease/phosphatase family metal-dependent hydrolase
MLGDLNSKCGREPQYAPTIGKESLHAISNRNGLRLISFAASNNMVLRSTTFPHNNKDTWKSSNRNMLNQIDHILIKNRFRSSIKNIRSYKGVDIDTDHFLLISKFKLKLQGMKSLKERKSVKFNVYLLKNENIRNNMQIVLIYS